MFYAHTHTGTHTLSHFFALLLVAARGAGGCEGAGRKRVGSEQKDLDSKSRDFLVCVQSTPCVCACVRVCVRVYICVHLLRCRY